MRNILIRTKGDVTNGMGHVQRCLTLARQLENLGQRVYFWTLPGTPGHERLLSAGYPVMTGEAVPMLRTPNPWRAIIVDVENGPERAFLQAVRDTHPQAALVVVGGSGYQLRDYEAVRELADLEVYQSVLPTDGPAGRVLSGIEYIMIDARFRDLAPDHRGGHVVVAMGGSDPHNLTPIAINALGGLGRRVDVVLGPACAEYQGVVPYNVRLWRALPNMLEPMRGAALFVGAFGMLAYEAMAAGLPCVLTNWSESHAETSVELERRGAVWSIGLWNELERAGLRERVGFLLSAPGELERMGNAGRALVDGRGVERVAERIVTAAADKAKAASLAR